METEIKELTNLVNIITLECKKNMQNIKIISDILEKLQPGVTTAVTPVEPVPDPIPEQLVNNFDSIDIIEKSHEVIINRRVELHKELGSYVEPVAEAAQVVEPVVEPVAEVVVTQQDYPTITPLLKLDAKQREKLFKQIFKEAFFNVEKIMLIDRDDALFKKSVTEESDRLLNVWMEINNKTKYM